LTIDTAGLPDAFLSGSADAANALGVLWSETGPDAPGFLHLPKNMQPAHDAAALAAEAPAATDVVVAGIGGSALSAIIMATLAAPVHAGSRPRLHVVDEVDPAFVDELLARIDPRTALLIGVSKSGSTLEAMAIFSLFEARFREVLEDDASQRIMMVSEATKSPLRAHAESHGYRTLDVPLDVGGRYSALTPVGLLPAALLGVSPERVLAGAASMLEALQSASVETNPALLLAQAHLDAQASGRDRALLWCYSAPLACIGPWWVQLVAESLGKPGPNGPEGCAPAWARGPADQHSLLQRQLEGPDDTLTTFLSVPTHGTGSTVPAGGGDAAGVTLGTLLEVQREAMQEALAACKRPFLDLRLAEFSPEGVGALLLTWQVAVAVWGRTRGINPFDQPGVQLGKTATVQRLRALRG
jgi:glucose-6-phosphate isomerase